MKINLIVLIGSIILLSSCGTSVENEEKTPQNNSITEAEVDDSMHLNNGQKWKVPEDMMGLIQQQKDKLFEYQMAGDTTFHKLGFELDSLCKELVQGCTMKGEAHNVLHT